MVFGAITTPGKIGGWFLNFFKHLNTTAANVGMGSV
jgi:hypothetical protein